MRDLPRYDAHTHTHFSDGTHSVMEVARAAEAAGLECVAITDHYAPGVRWLDDMLAQVESADAACQVKVLSGLEVTIADPEGTVHVRPDVAGAVDVVLAGLGTETRGIGRDPPADPARLIRNVCSAVVGACHNPVVDAIAHPLNLGRFPAVVDPEQFRTADLVQMAVAFASTDTAFELSNQAFWWFPDIPVARFTRQYAEVVRLFREYAVPFVLGSEAHSAEAVGNLAWALRVLRLAGVPASQVVDLPTTGPRRT